MYLRGFHRVFTWQMLIEQVREEYRRRFGEAPEVITRAPGRVNLIGEHTDYSGGFVFPIAIDRMTYLAAGRVSARSVVFSVDRGEGSPFDAATVEPGDMRKWTKYVAGVAWAMRQTGKAPGNLRAVVGTDIPLGGGLSSSAAIELAFAVAWNEMYDLGLQPEEMAPIGRACENQFVGANTGIMDQMASALGKAGQAMFIDTRDAIVRYAPVPVDLAVAILDTGVRHSHAGGEYGARRADVEGAEAKLGRSLRDATLSDLDRTPEPLTVSEYRRAHHVISENTRSLAFAQALDAGDRAAMGRLMREAHRSMQMDFEASCPELDHMAAAAWQTPGVVGARVTGGGFGGACVALVQKDQVDSVLLSILAQYKETSGKTGEAILTSASDGAQRVS